MNILFYTSFKPVSSKGGTERTTITLAKGLKEYYGWNSYSAYVVDEEQKIEDCFVGMQRLDEKKAIPQIEKLVDDWKIDCIIDQGDLWIAAGIDREKIERKCKLILAYHFAPEWDNTFFNRKCLQESLKVVSPKGQIKTYIKLLFFPLFQKRYIKRLRRYCRESYYNVDRVVLLSNGYFEDYATWAGITENNAEKLTAIPNALSYPLDYSVERIAEKKKRVLIVSRLDENQKRLSLALEIWKYVKKDPRADGWYLDIVGSGKDEKMYKEKVGLESIPDVIFHGRMEPKSFYVEASMFMMTSRSEGWPLTISEALQFGVVPVVFDTVAAFKEMIINDHTGLLITEGAQKEYSNSLLRLMEDDEYRISLAKSGIEHCRNFEPKVIASKWYDLIRRINWSETDEK